MTRKPAVRIGRRAPLGLRTTDELRTKLDEAASNSGRSLSQEVELRLERSFETEFLVTALVGGQAHSQILLRSIAKTIEGIEYMKGKKWTSDYETLVMCRNAVSRICSFVFGSDIDQTEYLIRQFPDEEERHKFLQMCDDFANMALRDLGQIIPPPPFGSASDPSRRVEVKGLEQEALGDDE